MHTVVFINSHSRQAAKHVAAIRRYFQRANQPFEILDFVVIDELDKLDVSLEKLTSTKNLQAVIVGSGDGTIVAVLNALKHRPDIVYGFLPLGTSNTFARSLNIPLDIKKALNNVSSGNIQPVSLGAINGQLFANIADIGVAVEVADSVTNRIKKYLGSLAYAISGLQALVHHDAIWCRLTIDGRIEEFYTHHLFVANGKNRGPVKVKGSSVFKPTLTLGYSTSKGRLDYLKDALNFIIGRSESSETSKIQTITTARIETKPTQSIQADGEIISQTPAEITIVKDAIRVILPDEAQLQKRKPRRSHR